MEWISTPFGIFSLITAVTVIWLFAMAGQGRDNGDNENE